MTGWLHLKLVEKANEGNQALAYPNTVQKGESKSGVGAAIERLGESLNK